MPKPNFIELIPGEPIPILYEDRSVLALDKPRHWMLVPFNWQGTDRNLHAALVSAVAEGQFWARSRQLRFLRHVHRLDADTTGILLLAKSLGALDSYSRLFESRAIEKTYLAVVCGVPKEPEWTCELKLAPDPADIGRMKVDARTGKEAETHFRVLETRHHRTLIEAHPLTGRTHQIRVHLAAGGHSIIGDPLYGRRDVKGNLALRAVELAYRDPFTRKPVRITASREQFLKEFGFGPPTGRRVAGEPASG